MKVARTPLEGARAEEARWAGLLPGEEPGRGLRRQVEEVEGEEAAEAMRRAAAKAKMAMLSSATGCTAPSGPKIVHPDMRTSRCPGALRGARAHFEMPGPRGGTLPAKSYEPNPAYVKQ